MKQTEINRLREICEKEGFRINEINNGISQFFQIDKKKEIKVEYTGWEYQGRLDSAVNIGFKVPNNFVMSIRLGELMAEFIKNHIENEKTS